MRRTLTTMLALAAATWSMCAPADLSATIAAKTAGATMKGDVASVKIGSMPVKIAMLVDPDGNVLELMELPKGADTLRHP